MGWSGMLRFFYIFVFCISSSLVYASEVVSSELSLNDVDEHQIAQSPMLAMTDEELSEVQGQALYSLNRQDQGGLSFYTLSMEAEVGLNANIKSLQVGCGGINGANGCDLDIQNFSLGCVANAAGICITLPKSYASQPNGQYVNSQNQLVTSQEASTNIPTSILNGDKTNSPAVGDITQSQLLDFVIKNPFFQFAIKNADSPSTREIVGVRLGGANVSGPMSFGALNTFSGYLSGVANLTMQGETNVGMTSKANSYWQNASAYMGLSPQAVDVLGPPVAGARTNFTHLTINYGTVSRSGLNVLVNGNRVTQAKIQGLNLSAVVDDIGTNLSLNQGTAGICALFICGGIDSTNISGWSQGIKDAILEIVKPSALGYVKQQLATGLGTTVSGLSTYQLPFNLNNVHQLYVNSNAFGLAFSKQNIQYPGYNAAVSTGWSMYIPNGFSLNINEKTSSLVSNIASNSFARDGNITQLAAPYRNCYGTLTFC